MVYGLWWVAFFAHTIHLLGHLLQALLYQGYTPGSFTALLSLPYCWLAFRSISDGQLLSPTQMLAWSGIGCVLLCFALFSALWLMRRIAHRFPVFQRGK